MDQLHWDTFVHHPRDDYDDEPTKSSCGDAPETRCMKCLEADKPCEECELRWEEGTKTIKKPPLELACPPWGQDAAMDQMESFWAEEPEEITEVRRAPAPASALFSPPRKQFLRDAWAGAVERRWDVLHYACFYPLVHLIWRDKRQRGGWVAVLVMGLAVTFWPFGKGPRRVPRLPHHTVRKHVGITFRGSSAS